MQFSSDVSGHDPPQIYGMTHAQAIAGWYYQTEGHGSVTPNGPWKMMDNSTQLKKLQKCGTPSGPLLAQCLLPVAPRNLLG